MDRVAAAERREDEMHALFESFVSGADGAPGGWGGVPREDTVYIVPSGDVYFLIPPLSVLIYLLPLNDCLQSHLLCTGYLPQISPDELGRY